MENSTNCPVGCKICWRNPWHVMAFFALLPFTVAGVGTIWAGVQAAIAVVTAK